MCAERCTGGGSAGFGGTTVGAVQRLPRSRWARTLQLGTGERARASALQPDECHTGRQPAGSLSGRPQQVHRHVRALSSLSCKGAPHHLHAGNNIMKPACTGLGCAQWLVARACVDLAHCSCPLCALQCC